MDTQALERYLHKQIPASKLLQIKALGCSDTHIELAAPLAPNINHKDTVFGGSLSVLAILTAWSLVYARLQGRKNEIVIQHSEMAYHAAARGDFNAVCRYAESTAWNKFERAFSSRSRGRIQVESTVYSCGELVATFTGSYVAFNKE